MSSKRRQGPCGEATSQERCCANSTCSRVVQQSFMNLLHSGHSPDHAAAAKPLDRSIPSHLRQRIGAAELRCSAHQHGTGGGHGVQEQLMDMHTDGISRTSNVYAD
jgi:hypothetical protein